MSKAFTKDDSSDAPLVIPARAPLPKGETNYVTARGLASLRTELHELEAERARLQSKFEEQSGSSVLATVTARVAELAERVASATLVDPATQPHDEVRFGATVTLRAEASPPRRYQIVGVDEADIQGGRVAFVAPLARALLGKRVGEVAIVRSPRGEEELEITAIAYDEA